MASHPKHSFVIREISNQTPFPTFSPGIVGCFSLNSKRQYIEGPEYLKFVESFEGTKRVNFNLDENLASTTNEEEEANLQETSELVQLLHWIRTHEDVFRRCRPHFVLYRGLMSKILGTPYENRDGWTIAGMYKNGTIYLRNVETPESIQSRVNYNAQPRLRRMAEWGVHFEHFLLSDEPHGQPDSVNYRKEECNVVYKAKINEHRVLYAAELDGVWVQKGKEINPRVTPERLSECKLVELKTTRFFPRGDMPENFRKNNLRKWWCQSFTARVSDIIVGFRNDAGVVEKLEVMPLGTLPKLGKEDWTGTVCFNFLDKFLTEVKHVLGEDEEMVYVFQFEPQRQRSLNREISFRTDPSLLLPNLL